MYKLSASLHNMDLHIVLPAFVFISSFMLCPSSALRLEFDVSNEFVSGNDVHLRLNSGPNTEGKEGRVSNGKSLSWSFTVSDYKPGTQYLCWVTEYKKTLSIVLDSSKKNGRGTEASLVYNLLPERIDWGSFEVLGTARIEASHDLPERMTIKCFVNEAGAAFLNAQTQIYEMIFHWPRMSFEFEVINNFTSRENIRLRAKTGGDALVKESVVPYKKWLEWSNHEQTNVPVTFKCEVARENPGNDGGNVETIYTFLVFKLDWFRGLDLSKRLTYKYYVYEDGAALWNPLDKKEDRWNRKD